MAGTSAFRTCSSIYGVEADRPSLSSSEGAEYAYESSNQQNGLFTYALMEALDGKGHPKDAKSPEVTMSEVAEYVKKRVGDLTNHKQTPNARRVNLEGDLPSGTTK